MGLIKFFLAADMPEISFGLIRKLNPDIDVDNIEAVEALKIENSGVTLIDELELFTHIKELYLSGNRIRLIQNLLFFDNLKHLDLSCNVISSDDLRASLKSIPKGLESINLSGNPCASDDDVLSELQDTHPDLGIIIEIVENGAEGDDGEEKEDRQETDESVAVNPMGRTNSPVDSDEILKYIVDRKCKAQSNSEHRGFDLEAAVASLDAEYSQTVEVSGHRLRAKQAHFEEKRQSTEQSFVSLDKERISRKEELIARNKLRDTGNFDAFMNRLKSTARDRLQEIAQSHVNDNSAAVTPESKKIRVPDAAPTAAVVDDADAKTAGK